MLPAVTAKAPTELAKPHSSGGRYVALALERQGSTAASPNPSAPRQNNIPRKPPTNPVEMLASDHTPTAVIVPAFSPTRSTNSPANGVTAAYTKENTEISVPYWVLER